MLYLKPKNRDFDGPKAEIQKRLNYAKYLKYIIRFYSVANM